MVENKKVELNRILIYLRMMSKNTVQRLHCFQGTKAAKPERSKRRELFHEAKKSLFVAARVHMGQIARNSFLFLFSVRFYSRGIAACSMHTTQVSSRLMLTIVSK